MNKYYLHDGSQNIGPFDIEELKQRKITRYSSVWCEGMPEWKNAAEVAELSTLFASIPPPINKFSAPPPTQKTQQSIEEKEPKTHWLITALRKTVILIFVLIGIAIIVNYFSEQNSNDSRSGLIDKTMSIAELEASYPTDYLSASGTYNSNFFGTKLKIDGYIDNKATITAYKDVTVEIIFYDKNKIELNRESFIINDFFPANTRKKFNYKVTKYENVASIGWDVSNAIPNR